jgi:hypothetical protein
MVYSDTSAFFDNSSWTSTIFCFISPNILYINLAYTFRTNNDNLCPSWDPLGIDAYIGGLTDSKVADVAESPEKHFVKGSIKHFPFDDLESA